MDVLRIYKKLLAHFGEQGWWPIFDRKTGKCQYSPVYKICSGRYRFCIFEKRAFEICVGAILTQNTAWKNVEKALANLSRAARGKFTAKFILYCKNLEKLIRPAGYYNQKAKKLRIFSKWWLCQPPPPKRRKMRSKKINSLSLVSCRLSLLSLWGIGSETADSMLLYAFGKPIFVIDVYTRRLCKECGVEFKTYDEYREFFEARLPKSAKLFNEYHALIVAWGKLYSKDRSSALKIIKRER